MFYISKPNIIFNKILKNFKGSEIYKNILSVSSGNLISQIISIIFIPILARVYDATAFGFLSIFISYAGILASISTLKYELAISLPKSERIASTVTKISIFSSLVISGIYLLIISFFYGKLSNLIKLETSLLFLLPLTTFSIALFSSNQQLNMRQGRYNYTARVAVFLSITNLFVAFVLSFNFNNIGLAVGYFISYLLSSLIMTRPVFKDLKKQVHFKYIPLYIKVFKEFSSFPKVMVFTNLLTIASQQGIPIILSYFFLTSDVGYFSMANRVVMLPTIILGTATSSVFRFHFSKINYQNISLRPSLLKLIKKLTIIGVPVFMLISIFSPYVFPIFLGNEWTISGKYASVLSIVAFSHFLNISISNIYIILQKQAIFFLIQSLLLVCIITSVYIGYKYFDSLFFVIIFISISFLLYTFINVLVTYFLTSPKFRFDE